MVDVRVINRAEGGNLPGPRLFRISQKPQPKIVALHYFLLFEAV